MPVKPTKTIKLAPPRMPLDKTWSSAVDMGRAIAAGAISSEALVSASLERIHQLDGQLHAFVMVLGERAMAIARARDLERAAGYLRSPLHGVPVAIKDLFDLAGYRTGAGSRAFPDHIAAKTAHAVQRLEDAGAVVVGKTHTVEFAFGGWGTNPILGAPWNPHDLGIHRVAGGSSSGSAVAVASGMVPLALGTDTGGSIRIPASLCGVLGLKSSPGSIGRSGTRYLSRSHDTVGPLARSIEDIALAYDIMVGPDAGDRHSVWALPKPATPVLNAPLNGMRIGVLYDPAMSDIDPEITAAFATFLGDLATLGCRVDPFRLPMQLEEISRHAGRIMSAESYAELREIMDDTAMDIAPAIRERIAFGRNILATDYLELMALKHVLITRFLADFMPFQVLVAPAAPLLAPPLESIDESKSPLSTFGRFVNMLDLCALALPIAMSRQRLPIGVQIIGRQFDDALILRIGAALECHREGLFTAPTLS